MPRSVTKRNAASFTGPSTDGGTSWVPENDVENGNVQRVRAVSGTTFYAFGSNTLLQSTDGGATWAIRSTP